MCLMTTRTSQKGNVYQLESFLKWLDQKLSELDWNDATLAKRAGISHSVLSKARAGERPIGWDACVSIATALKISPEIVLQKAGLLPSLSQASSEEEKELVFLFQQLPPERQKEFLKMMRVLLPEEKK